MSWDDYIDTDYIDLPEEAVIPDAHPFEPNDEWLSSAQPEHQLEAMKRWFQARFVDPAQETPYDGGEGAINSSMVVHTIPTRSYRTDLAILSNTGL